MIAGADAGSKAEKATQLGVPLLGEDALDVLLRGDLPAMMQESEPDAASAQ